MKNLMAYTFALAVLAMSIGAGVYLVITEHYWWAWIPFLIACNVSVKHVEDEKPEPSPIITDTRSA